MRRYMKADFYRIFGRISRYVTLLVIFALFGALLYFTSDGKTPYELVETLTSMVPFVVPILGLVEFGVVYGDDIKAKTMTIAIGSGIPRPEVILVKWVELLLLTALDLVILTGISFAVSVLRQAVFSGEPLRDILVLEIFALLKLAGTSGMTMILVFGTLNVTLGSLLFLLSGYGLIGAIFDAVLQIGPLASLHLNAYTFEAILEAAKARMIIGTFSVPHMLGVLLYLVVFYLLAVAAFRRRELDF